MNMNDGKNTNDFDEYINDVADLDDDVSVEDTTETDTQTTEVKADVKQEGTVDDTSATKDLQGDDKGDDKSKQAPEQKADAKSEQLEQDGKDTKKNALRPLGDGTFANEKGDIVDEKGVVIAQRGFAARVYNENRRLKASSQDLTERYHQLLDIARPLKSLHDSITQAGLSHDDTAKAIDLAARMQRDPVSVAKEVVAMVVAQGYNVTDLLGNDVGDSLDMRAVQQMLDQRLSPITQEVTTRQQQQENEQKATQAYQKFVQTNAYAEVHADDIVKVMQRNNMHPQQAYDVLMDGIYKNGFDPSKPLAPQVEARKADAAQQNNQQQQQTKPMPNGASTRNTATVPTNEAMYSADDDWDKIIRDSMRTQ